jgi:hypothetical protein
MGKIILEFDSENEANDAKSALDGWRWKSAMWELDQYLRNEIKYNDKNSSEVTAAYEKLRNKIREILDDNLLQIE